MTMQSVWDCIRMVWTCRVSKKPTELLAIAEAMIKNPDWAQDPNQDKGHNVHTVFNSSGEILQFVPYDFDMTMYTNSNAQAPDWDDTKAIGDSLSGTNDGRKALHTIFEYQDDIRDAFENGFLNDESKDLFRTNFESFMKAAQEF